MKQIPNLFTLLNLVCGCIAIVLILQPGEAIVQLENTGASYVQLPERIWWGALFLFAAAVIDFLDGFLARLFKASSEMGKQLDSLSDVVSFGVAPGMTLYQLLRIAYAQNENGLDVSLLALLPAFIFPAAGAWRLARFNISTDQSLSFRGTPIPAAGLVVASLPLIIHYNPFNIRSFFINEWVLYAITLLFSYLMISSRRFMALKFKDYSFKNNTLKYFLAGASVVLIFVLGWLSVPVIFLLYALLSAFSKEEPVVAVPASKETPDATI